MQEGMWKSKGEDRMLKWHELTPDELEFFTPWYWLIGSNTYFTTGG